MSWQNFSFTDDFQEAIIACLIHHPAEFEAYGDIVRPEFFSGLSTTLLVTALGEYREKYQKWPQGFTVLANYAHDTLLRKNPQEADEMLALCRRLANINTDDWRAVRDRVIDFARERAVLNAVKRIHWHVTEGKTDKIDPVKELQDALTVHEGEAELRDARDLIDANLPLPKELVEGLIHKGTKVMLGGASKALKSWLLICLAVAVATGSKWLGRKCREGSVLFLNFEIADEFFARRLAALEKAMGVAVEPGCLIHASLRGKNQPLEKTIAKLLSWTRGSAYSLVVIDPIYKMLIPAPGRQAADENSSADIAQALNQLDRVASETGAAVAWAAHYAKGDSGKKNAIDRVSGSGVFARDPDSIITLTDHQDEQDVSVIEPILRNFPPTAPFCVRWEFPIFVPAPECDPTRVKTKARERNSKYQDSDLLKPLLASQEPLTLAEWFQTFEGTKLLAMGLCLKTLERHAANMIKAGKVIKIGKKYRACPLDAQLGK